LPPRPDFFPPPPRFEVDKMLQKKGDETGAV